MAAVRNASKEIVGMVIWDDLVRILLSTEGGGSAKGSKAL
jgi:hypothetical protein